MRHHEDGDLLLAIERDEVCMISWEVFVSRFPVGSSAKKQCSAH